MAHDAAPASQRLTLTVTLEIEPGLIEEDEAYTPAFIAQQVQDDIGMVCVAWGRTEISVVYTLDGKRVSLEQAPETDADEPASATGAPAPAAPKRRARTRPAQPARSTD